MECGDGDVSVCHFLRCGGVVVYGILWCYETS